MLTKKDIIDAFTSIGVTPGDILMLQSSYKGCGEVENGPDGLIDALLELLGPEGTLIMPSYNLSMWTEQHYFDLLETPSTSGILTEIFRKREGVGRTAHPIHPLAVWGKRRDELMALEYSNSFGEDSVFARLFHCNAMCATIGLDKMGFIQSHYTEFLMKVPYRRLKHFGGIYLDKERKASVRVYNLNVRINTNREDLMSSAHVYMVREGTVPSHSANGVFYTFARTQDYHRYLTSYIESFPHLFGY